MAKTETSDSRLIEMVRGAGFSFGPVIVAEAGREGCPLALALALVEQESTFRNIFGCDGKHPINRAPWCHQHVTRDRVQALIRHVEQGGISNGVGLTQLTDIGLIRQAEAEGGAHTVHAQCRIGFRNLHHLIEQHGEATGIGEYNGGPGHPIPHFADSVIGLRAKWRGRINGVLGPGAFVPGDAGVHRDLTLTTPFTEGPDVKRLQRAIDDRARELPFTDAMLTQDGQFGRFTLRASERVAFALGLSEEACSVIRDGTVAQRAQQLIRHPSGLSAEERQRAHDREPALKRRYEAQHRGARAAVRWAHIQARRRVHEHPDGSNWGHPVQDWIKFTGYPGHVAWCGCFVAFAVVKKGGANVPKRIHLGYDQDIIDDVRAGRNGFQRAVSVHHAKPGDIATFLLPPDNDPHIGLVVGPTRNGLIHTIDGNTTTTDGSSSHGGAVAEKWRPVSQVTIVGRLHY
jgi:hypothetical protein